MLPELFRRCKMSQSEQPGLTARGAGRGGRRRREGACRRGRDGRRRRARAEGESERDAVGEEDDQQEEPVEGRVGDQVQ
eukprot:3878388-Alexandrium_andersonii.AAC.1